MKKTSIVTKLAIGVSIVTVLVQVAAGSYLLTSVNRQLELDAQKEVTGLTLALAGNILDIDNGFIKQEINRQAVIDKVVSTNQPEQKYQAILQRYENDTKTALSFFLKDKYNKYTRVATTVKNADGEIVIGTTMDEKSTAYSAVNSGRMYEGDVSLFGSDFKSTYIPVYGQSKEVVGAFFIGMPLTDLQETTSEMTWILLFTCAASAVCLLAAIRFISGRFVVKPLDSLERSVANLSSGNGDLTHRLVIYQNDEIGRVTRNINTFLDSLHKVIINVASSSEYLAEQSVQSHKIAENNKHSLVAQQSEITQIATALEEMSTTASGVASSAEITAGAAQNSSEFCLQGLAVIDNNQKSVSTLAEQLLSAAQTIGQLEVNAKKIDLIINTIQDVSAQTSLLALNAAIEAARAGEHGRGFAVVADEVRALSNRAHAATEEIRAMIEDLQNNTASVVAVMNKSRDLAEHSVNDANEAAASIHQITSAIQEITNMAMQIASSAEEQRAVAAEIGRNVQLSKDVTDDLTRSAHEATDVADELSQIAEKVKEQVGVFRI